MTDPDAALMPLLTELVRVAGRTVTSSMPLRDWVVPVGSEWDIRAVADSGVAQADLDRWGFARVGGDGWSAYSPAGFVAQVRELATRWPDLSLRDAVGWVLVVESAGDEVWDCPAAGSSAMTAQFVAPWARVGLLADGWRCVAAGYAVEQVAADPQAWRVLAALTGVRVLAGD